MSYAAFVAAAIGAACHDERPREHVTVAWDAASSSLRSVPPVPASGCPALVARERLGPGTLHAPHVSGNETWTAEASPHRLPEGLVIDRGASLSVVPCSVILVASGRTVLVGPDAALFAMGEAARPIRLDAETRGATWEGLRFARDARPTSRLRWTTLADAIACVADAMPGLDLEHVNFANCGVATVALLDGGSLAR